MIYCSYWGKFTIVPKKLVYTLRTTFITLSDNGAWLSGKGLKMQHCAPKILAQILP